MGLAEPTMTLPDAVPFRAETMEIDGAAPPGAPKSESLMSLFQTWMPAGWLAACPSAAGP